MTAAAKTQIYVPSLLEERRLGEEEIHTRNILKPLLRTSCYIPRESNHRAFVVHLIKMQLQYTTSNIYFVN